MKYNEEQLRIGAEKALIMDLFLNKFPTGIMSYVSDTYNIWDLITKILPQLKEKIMARDGKAVFRPDSGNPADILCGLSTSDKTEFTGDEIRHPSYKGVIELLWDIFGGKINSQGFKVLDSHVGAIYGDSITLDRAEEICERLKQKGFASTNVVFGVGSYSMGYATRDNQGSAVKATYVEVNGKGREIFKDPITDDGTKKSARGLIAVFDGKLKDQCTWDEVNSDENQLTPLFKDGKFLKNTTITKIREKLNG